MSRWINRTSAKRVAQAANPGFTLHQWAMGGAWFFALGSLFPLFWLAFSGSDGRVFGTTTGGVDHSVWLLSYSGWTGFALMWAEIIAILAANAMTFLPNRRAKALGHGIIVAWAGLWTVGAGYLATYDGFFVLQTAFMGALFGCVSYRAWNSLRHVTRDGAPAPLALDSTSPPSEELTPNSAQEPSTLIVTAPMAGLVHDSPTIDVDSPWKRRLTTATQSAWRWTKRAADRAWNKGIPATGRIVSKSWRRLRDGYQAITAPAAPNAQTRV